MANAAQLVVSQYLAAASSGDVDRALSLVGEEFSLQTPAQQSAGEEGREELRAHLGHVGPFARGHRLIRQWVDGDEVCSIYELRVEPPGAPVALTISQWDRVRRGKVQSSVMIFDTGVFHQFILSDVAAVDPVCHMRVDSSAPSAAVRHDGQDYYFCSPGCAERFQTHPQRYLAGAPSRG